MKYMKWRGDKVEAMLRVSSVKWGVEFIMYSTRTCKLSKGWIEFARANCLQEGDVCIFELTKMDGFLFDVHIFGN